MCGETSGVAGCYERMCMCAWARASVAADGLQKAGKGQGMKHLDHHG